MKKYLQSGFLLIVIATSASVVASGLLKIDLKNRSATGLKAVLSRLVDEDIKIIADGNSLILRGERTVLTQLKQIIIDLDVASVSLSVSIYRGVDPNVLKNRKDVQIWGTHKASNRLDTVIIESGQRLVINETKLLVVPIESFGSGFNAVFDADSSLNDLVSLDTAKTQLEAVFERSDIIAIDNSLFVEASLLSARKVQSNADALKEKVFVRYGVPIHVNSTMANKNSQLPQVLSTQTHVSSQRVINTGEWLQLSGHQVVSHRPTLGANKTLVSTQKQTDSDNNIWLRVNRVN